MDTQDDDDDLGETQRIESPPIVVASTLKDGTTSNNITRDESFQINTTTGATPFLSKVRDPFAESPLIKHSAKAQQGFQTPHSAPRDNGNAFGLIRLRQQQEQVMEYDDTTSGIVIDDEDEVVGGTDDSFRLNDTYSQKATQIIMDDDTQAVNFEVASTQQQLQDAKLKSLRDTISIEVPSTAERWKPHELDIITSQQSVHKLDFEKGSKHEISCSDDDAEIENSTAQYNSVELDDGNSHEELGFPEDSLKIYDQLRAKRRQFSGLESSNKKMKQKPSSNRSRTDIENTIPNSSPSIAQLLQRPDTQEVLIQSSPTLSKTAFTYLAEEDEEGIVVVSSTKTPRATVEDVYRESIDELSTADIKHITSVWARVADKFYPTVVKEVLPDGFLIIHQGKSVHLQGFANIWPLDIKIGDRVKIQGERRVHYVVGLSAGRPHHVTEPNAIRCVRGFDTVHAVPCLKNEPLSGAPESIFPLEQVYLVSSIWTKRKFLQDLNTAEFQETLAQLGSEALPRYRGRNARNLLELSPHKRSVAAIVQNDTAISTPTSPLKKKLEQAQALQGSKETQRAFFQSCLFTITSATEQERIRLTAMITELGGIVLEDGIAEILDAACTNVKEKFTDFKFAACLSSNGYCRSAKYLEALALGWPVLSDKFIYDNHLTGALPTGEASKIEFEPYLLPSGESALLNDQIRSVDLFNFKQKLQLGLTLSDQLDDNPVFSKVTVLRILESSSAASVQKAKIAEFSFRVMRAKDIITARSWDQLADQLKSLLSSETTAVIFSVDQEDVPDACRDLGAYVMDWERLVQCIITQKFTK